MKNIKYLLLATALLFSACKKDELPGGHPGTLRCKVNGVEWTPDWPLIYTPFQLQYYDDTKAFILSATRRVPDLGIDQSIVFDADSVMLGENKIKPRKRNFKDHNLSGNCAAHDLDTLQTHILTIKKIDREKRSISGTFQFSANNFNYNANGEACNNAVHITDGEFNLGY